MSNFTKIVLHAPPGSEDGRRHLKDEDRYSVAVVHAALELVSPPVDCATPEQVAGWTVYERALAYDWATRLHLSQSNARVFVRPRPSFTRTGA